MHLLTIAIPTYSRNALLKTCVAAIAPQLNEQVRLLILDNHSPEPVRLDPLPPFTTIIRNPLNIGGNGNIIRCFENAESEWIWVIGDDDRVLDAAVAKALELIRRYPLSAVINFSTSGAFCREADIEGTGRSALLNSIDDFGNVLFISSNLYRRSVLIGRIEFGYHYMYSCAPHLAMLLMSMGAVQGFLLSKEKVVHWQRPQVENRGSVLTIARGLPALLDLPLEPTERSQLAKLLARFPRIAAIAHQCFLECVYGARSAGEMRAEFGSILTRIPLHAAIWRRLVGSLWLILLWCPRLSYRFIIRPLYRWKTGVDSGMHSMKMETL